MTSTVCHVRDHFHEVSWNTELGWLLIMASADLVHSEGLASVVKQYHAKLRREAKKGRGYRIARVNCPHVM